MDPATSDLTALEGVGTEYAALLRAAGVDRPSDLADCDATELLARMAAVNDRQHLVRRLPNIEMTASWIHQAAVRDASVPD